MAHRNVRTFGCVSCVLALIPVVLGACAARRAPSEVSLRGSSAESVEEVVLDPIFVSRQKKAEAAFFGFAEGNGEVSASPVAANSGANAAGQWAQSRYDISSDEDDANAAVTAIPDLPVPQNTPFFASPEGLFWPVRGSISSPFGMRKGRLHAGIDIRSPKGTPIVAAASGQVLTSRRKGAYGNVVIVGHDYDHQTLYAHMIRFLVREGTFVKKGQVLGMVGRTGRATGFHLHFETRVSGGIPQNPLKFLPASQQQGVELTAKLAGPPREKEGTL